MVSFWNFIDLVIPLHWEKKSIKNWLDCWKSEKGFFSGRTDDEQAESWNRRWSRPTDDLMSFPTRGRNRKRMDEIFGFLEEVGFRIPGSRILDVGCGPGSVSVPFAKAGAKVTSLDISSIALRKTREKAREESVMIETLESSWWSADIDDLGLRGKFDLVFVTSTPAVRDAGCFDRMIGCSRDFCYYSFLVGNGGHMQADHRDLWHTILKREQPRHGMANGRDSMFINGFMYLYLLGYRPQVRIHHHSRRRSISWEKAAGRTIASMENTSTLSNEEKDRIIAHYRDTAIEGVHTSVSEGYSGMMAWKVGLPGKNRMKNARNQGKS